MANKIYLDKSGLTYFWSKIKAKLATKADTNSLATVATSGSYNDLSNKPTVDSTLSSSSTNAVQNQAVYAAIGDVESILQTLNSGNGV